MDLYSFRSPRVKQAILGLKEQHFAFYCSLQKTLLCITNILSLTS